MRFNVKEKLVSLAGACFWYWNSYHSFLDSCGVSKALYTRYPKDTYNKYDVMRNVIDALEEQNKNEVVANIISGFYRLSGAIDKDNLDNKKAVQLLKEFRDVVGNDPIEAEIERQRTERARETHAASVSRVKSNAENLSDLNQTFLGLTTISELTPQQRGFRLEKIIFELLRLSEFEYSKSYRTADGEQIDGHFKYEKFDYLVEAKWIEGLTKQKDLSVFDGKIRGKAQSTRGLFLAANGFDSNAVTKFSDDSPRIVLMTGQDLALILGGQMPFSDAMKKKVDAIVRCGEINKALY